MLKRLLSVFITVLMVVAMCSTAFCVFATETPEPTAESTEPKIVVSTVTDVADATVALTVSIVNNPGISTLRLQLDFDKYSLAVKNATDSELMSNGLFTGQKLEPYTLYWFNPMQDYEMTEDGVLATVEFKVAADVKDGALLAVTPRLATVYDAMNKFDETVQFEMVAGGVQIPGIYTDDSVATTYTYDFKGYTGYDYDSAVHSAISFANNDSVPDAATPYWWDYSSGMTDYGLLMSGATEFTEDYDAVPNKVTLRGTEGIAAKYNGGNIVAVRPGYKYKVTVKYVPIDVTSGVNGKISIGLSKDSELCETKTIGATKTFAQSDTARGWTINIYNIMRSSEEKKAMVADTNGVLFTDHYTANTANYTAKAQTLTATYTGVEADAGSMFSVLVGSVGSAMDNDTRRSITQVLITEVTVVVTPPGETTATFTEGAVTSDTYYSTDSEIMMPVPSERENFAFWTTDNGGLYKPYDFVSVEEGSAASFRAVYIPRATSAAFSYRAKTDEWTAGIRFRGELADAVVESAEDIGFAIIPQIAVPTSDWYDIEAKTDKHTLFIAAEDFRNKYYKKTETGYQYQLRISDLSTDVLMSADFAVAIYVKDSAGAYTYYYIGCEDYNTVVANINSQSN
ncbi:MAG: hypothetical protein E7525_03765 [Ruminococcaceae bacterium]|nr:hypothetical protein [Oscillospiraceae bacterium]